MKPTAVPNRIILDLTSKCNLRCSYCCFFHSPEESGHTDLPGSEWKHFIRECGRLGVMEISFRGGEPLLHNDFRELVQAVTDNRMRFKLQTNGTLLDRELAGFLTRSKRCNAIKFSLDGPPGIHDNARGEGSYSAALRGIEEALRHNLPVIVTATIHRQNYPRLEEIARHLLQELKLPMVTLSAALSGTTPAGWAIDREMHREMIPVLNELDRKYQRQLPGRGMIGHLRRWKKLFSGELPETPFGSCGAFCGTLSVRSDGSLVPCLDMMSRPLGQINRDPLEDIWRHSTELEALRSFRINPEQFPLCRECRYRNACRNCCPARTSDPGSGIGCLKDYIDACGEEMLQ